MLRILIVDDEAAVRAQLVAGFCARSHHVVEAVSGRTARAALKASSFDVILTDLIMPDGTGFDLIRRTVAEVARPRIVALSSKGNPPSDYLQCALACGADLVVAKTVPLPSLVTAVEAVATADTTKLAALRRRWWPRTSVLRWPQRLLRRRG